MNLCSQRILDTLRFESDSAEVMEQLRLQGFSEDEIDEAWSELSQTGKIREKIRREWNGREQNIIGQLGHWEVVE